MTDIDILQGTDSGVRWVVNDNEGAPYDFTGWSAQSQVRESADTGAVLHEWSTTIGNAAVGSDGYVTLFWTHAQTSAWTWRRGVYDIELTSPDGKVSRLDGGFVRVEAEVTR